VAELCGISEPWRISSELSPSHRGQDPVRFFTFGVIVYKQRIFIAKNIDELLQQFEITKK